MFPDGSFEDLMTTRDIKQLVENNLYLILGGVLISFPSHNCQFELRLCEDFVFGICREASLSFFIPVTGLISHSYITFVIT